uniref:Uncharacterized protein n=1 Tax=Chromera velia CCMP2878 TaxID=1169474 RepID=A0A0K6S6M5_9ALVE|eukprot:Cvel_16629.t1-p1 / transcript=Cvel_16629.t1 / gene=Cvel_16629 / organism=Chromera_velia_CCMP2878 / gene_product=hypothetical protein / transcript_product=hypothetical protein / location=Cvel_scaffold1289:15886-16614(+) / protein_length=243 / sequence_SO=supercontig / SO=protein_coding / is_pseudo=false
MRELQWGVSKPGTLWFCRVNRCPSPWLDHELTVDSCAHPSDKQKFMSDFTKARPNDLVLVNPCAEPSVSPFAAEQPGEIVEVRSPHQRHGESGTKGHLHPRCEAWETESNRLHLHLDSQFSIQLRVATLIVSQKVFDQAQTWTVTFLDSNTVYRRTTDVLREFFCRSLPLFQTASRPVHTISFSPALRMLLLHPEHPLARLLAADGKAVHVCSPPLIVSLSLAVHTPKRMPSPQPLSILQWQR